MRKNNKRSAGFELLLLIICLLAVAGLIGFRIYTSQQQSASVPQNDVTKPVDTFKRVVAVGDIVCDPSDEHAAAADPDFCQDEKVAQQITKISPQALLLLGDLQYHNGAPDAFKSAFAKSWQQFKGISYPTPGNHEYQTAGAAGYYGFFSDAPVDVSKGYFTFKLGDWQIFSLNSNCNKIGGCDANSAQMQWLEKELSSTSAKCTLAFWHHPRFTSGSYYNDAKMSSLSSAMWASLLKHRADVVLNGHDHLYERFQKQTAEGDTTATGIREFIAGTGGRSHYTHKTISKNSQKIIDNQFGVLVMDLHPAHYTWQFRSISGEILDSGREDCY